MSTSRGKRQQYKVGAIVKVPLEPGWHTYARLLQPPLLAFYDSRSNRELPLEEIISKPILFKIAVMRDAVTSGRWQKIGAMPLESHLVEEPVFFRQDALKPDQFFLYRGGQEYPATRAECVGLERAAVWEAEHVEDRLRDHYAGRPNRWVESLKPTDA